MTPASILVYLPQLVTVFPVRAKERPMSRVLALTIFRDPRCRTSRCRGHSIMTRTAS